MRDHERCAGGVELQQHIHGAAVFECTAGLEVFALEEDLGAHARIEGGGPHDRCPHHVRRKSRGRGHDIRESGQTRGHNFAYSGARKCSR
jgi:hypothetical protein